MLATRTNLRRGFTLMELLVAMAITTIIVTVLVSVTSIALDTWNRSRSELRASRQAKEMIDTMARDFEGMVIRRGTPHEWLSANYGWYKENKPFGTTPVGFQKTPGVVELPSTNASKLIFFTAATDRYNGEISETGDLGGEISCVAYILDYKDPMSPSGSTFKTFALNRLLVNPNDTLNDLLGILPTHNKSNTRDDSNNEIVGLMDAFEKYDSKLSNQENFLCENVFQFSVTFHVQVTRTNGTSVTVPIALGSTSGARTTKSFKVNGTEIICDATGGASGGTTVTNAEIKAGRVAAVELSLTILTDFAIDQLKSRSFNDTQKADFLAKHSYQYIKVVQVPST